MKKIIAFLLTILLLLMSIIVGYAQTIDLSVMTKDELEQLRSEIDAELKANHSTSNQEEKTILGLTKDYIEQYLISQDAKSISWPWLDYTYSKDWNFYTIRTNVTYKTVSGKNNPNVYTELYEQNGVYGLYYAKIGDTVVLDNRKDIPDSRFNGGKEISQSNGAKTNSNMNNKAIPVVTPTPEPKTFFGFNDPATNDNLVYTMLSYRESKGSTFNKADDGKVFLLVEFLVENKGTSSKSISFFSFNAYCDDYAADVSFSASLEAKTSLSGEIAPGKKLKGEIGIEAPKNWKEFELHLDTGWFSDAIVFKGTR